MKTYKIDSDFSLYSLKYDNIFNILEEIDKNESDSKEYDEEYSDDSSIELSTQEYMEITDKVIYSISLNSNNKPDEYFSNSVIIENEIQIIDVKNFIDIIKKEFGIELDDVEIYCMFNRYKYENGNNDSEYMNYTKLRNDILLKRENINLIFSIKKYLTDYNITLNELLSPFDKVVDHNEFKIYLQTKGILKDNETLINTKRDNIERNLFFKDNKVNLEYLKTIFYEYIDDEAKYNFDEVYSERKFQMR